MKEHLASLQFALEVAMAKAMGIPMLVLAGGETRKTKTIDVNNTKDKTTAYNKKTI